MEEETNQTKHSEMLMDFQAPLYLGHQPFHLTYSSPGTPCSPWACWTPHQKKSICSLKTKKSPSQLNTHPLDFQPSRNLDKKEDKNITANKCKPEDYTGELSIFFWSHSNFSLSGACIGLPRAYLRMKFRFSFPLKLRDFMFLSLSHFITQKVSFRF